MPKWTREEIELVKHKASKGQTYEEIGKVLGRTGKSVSIKMQKMGITHADLYPPTIKYCQNCDKLITGYGVKFCSRSCAATVNNKEFPKRVSESKSASVKCKNCGKEVEKRINKKYCSRECQTEYRRGEIREAVLKDDNTLTTKAYRNFLIEEFGAKCMECGWDKINPHSGKCPIELEHIDGNHTNNTLDNLKLLCPNCHSLTSTYKGLNRGFGRRSRSQRYQDGKSY